MKVRHRSVGILQAGHTVVVIAHRRAILGEADNIIDVVAAGYFCCGNGGGTVTSPSRDERGNPPPH